MEGKCLLDVTHERGVSDSYPSESFLVYEGDRIAGNIPVVTPEQDDECA